MHYFVLLKSGNCEAIALRYTQITSFATGSVLVTKFAMHGRSNDVSRRNTEGDIDESLVPQSIRDPYDGTDDQQDTDLEHNSDCAWTYEVPESLYENVLKKEFDHKKCNNIIF